MRLLWRVCRTIARPLSFAGVLHQDGLATSAATRRGVVHSWSRLPRRHAAFPAGILTAR